MLRALPALSFLRNGYYWLVLFIAFCTVISYAQEPSIPLLPEVSSQSKPWTYWWWMGSAVDKDNITRQLKVFKEAGLGGVHIIPIYGAKGFEDRYIDFMSKEWLEMLDYTVTQADRLGMGVDMTLGTGWCFGGPSVSDRQANAKLVYKRHTVSEGNTPTLSSDKSIQSVMAYGPDGQVDDLIGRVTEDNQLSWKAPAGKWTVYELWQEPSGRDVKRAAPGGKGHMLNPFYGEAVDNYLRHFDPAFGQTDISMPRAFYHDSYEYICDWSPNLLQQFEWRRGYRLQDHLPMFLTDEVSDVTARLKADYRRTVSDMMCDDFIVPWTDWSHGKGCVTRNQAHGSPANLLDLYAAADIPETEFFRFDRNPLVSKMASSAAHVMGRKYASSETGTWLKEHFHVSTGHLKNFIDGLFVSGINHVFYHGCCYSPSDVPWPGWLFYASTQMNPRNSLWHDVDALNAYIARCQAVLQSGQPDNDVLLYWPIEDLWHDSKGLTQNLTVHHVDWLKKQPIGKTASQLWNCGYTFDYISDRLLKQAGFDGKITVNGNVYDTIVVPPCAHIPLDTFEKLLELAQAGAVIIFEQELPGDVPGFANLSKRRADLKEITKSLQCESKNGYRLCKTGRGAFLVGSDMISLLDSIDVRRETMVDHDGIQFIRRKENDGYWYFITNQDSQFTENPQTKTFDGWLPLAHSMQSAVMLDPMTGRFGNIAVKQTGDSGNAVYLQIEPGQSVLLRTFNDTAQVDKSWAYYQKMNSDPVVTGDWQIEFIQGGPELPAALTTPTLRSWTEFKEPALKSFAGTARYSITFDIADVSADAYRLDLGQVCFSAKITLNGHNLGKLVSRPFAVLIETDMLRKKNNNLQIEVTNLSANRIADLDRKGVKWANYHDINFVNIDYKPFDASGWKPMDSGLLGPVKLCPLKKLIVSTINK